MDAVVETETITVTRETMSARVFADAHRSFAAEVDALSLEIQAAEVVGDLWTESTKVTTFIPVLALRDLRERIERQGPKPDA